MAFIVNAPVLEATDCPAGTAMLPVSVIVVPEFCNSLPVVESNLAIALSVELDGPTTSPDPPIVSILSLIAFFVAASVLLFHDDAS